MEKTCNVCKATKPVTEFHKRGDGDGYRSACRACHNAKTLSYYAKNKPKWREAEKRFRIAHPEQTREKLRLKKRRQRAILRGLTEHATDEDKRGVLVLYGNRCLACLKEPPEARIVLDHVVPLSKGGKDTADNLQPLCEDCNNRKHATSTDFRPRNSL